MALEEVLTQKTYYEKYMNGSKLDPFKVLGDQFFQQQKEEPAHLADIRFAQGELYFHYQDYESAIFKWEQVQSELEPWAKKNMADAYLELELLDTAESIYKSITPDSLVLQTEILLQLFGIYLAWEKSSLAKEMIQQAVVISPDYPNVTKLARAFYEETEDWDCAINLAMNESVRTGDEHWFSVLIHYIEKGKTTNYRPSYFLPVLSLMGSVDFKHFEQITKHLWESYEEGDFYLEWLHDLTTFFVSDEEIKIVPSATLSSLCKKSYLTLLSGTYLYKELEELIPRLLDAWMKVVDQNDQLFCATAVLAWNDQYPSSNDKKVIDQSRRIVSNDDGEIKISEKVELLSQEIQEWMMQHELHMDERIKQLLLELKTERTHVLLGSTNPANCKFLLSAIHHDPLLHTVTTGTIMLSGDSQQTSKIVTKNNQISWKDYSQADTQELTAEDLICHYAVSGIVEEGAYSFLDFTHISWDDSRQTLPSSMAIVEQLVFILNEKIPFTSKERGFLEKIQSEAPDVPFTFYLPMRDQDHQFFEQTSNRIRSYFPEAAIHKLTLSIEKQPNEVLNSIVKKLQGTGDKGFQQLRVLRLLLTELAQQHECIKKNLTITVEKDQDLLARLKGSINQLQDVEDEQIKVFRSSLLTMNREVRSKLQKYIPEKIKKTADSIQEDRDFRTLHLELNTAMNEAIENYLTEDVLPYYVRSLDEWIEFASKELDQSQQLLTEWSESFNEFFTYNRLKLAADFQVLTDWERDADRITSSVDYEKENILLRRTPSQVLLKGAGKLLNTFPRNKQVLVNAYKNFILNEEYEDVVERISNKFFHQFELFEKGLGRDIHIFFREPFQILKNTVEELEEKIEKNQTKITQMNNKPELYLDPLMFFEVRLRQYEWMNRTKIIDLKISQSHHLQEETT